MASTVQMVIKARMGRMDKTVKTGEMAETGEIVIWDEAAMAEMAVR